MQLIIGSVWEPLHAYYKDFAHENIIVMNTKFTKKTLTILLTNIYSTIT
jgi:hypothetical protein